MEWKDRINTFKQIDVRGTQGNFFQGLKKQAMQLPAGSGIPCLLLSKRSKAGRKGYPHASGSADQHAAD